MDAAPRPTASLYEADGFAGNFLKHSSRLLSTLAVICAIYATLVAHLWGQSHDSYEGLEVSWRLADHDCGARLVQHQRALGQAHSGQASEYIHFRAGAGSYVHLVTPVKPCGVIDELMISLWVRANRPGLQLAARVVLPRTPDPRSGEPLTTLIRGTVYEEPEKWQKLSVDNPLKLLNRQIPMLRSQFGSQVSPREAYVDLLVLNGYGGAGETQIWLDDLTTSGQVTVDAHDLAGDVSRQSSDALNPLATSKSRPVPQLQGSVLSVEGTPQLVRAIDHNGEPFAWLKTLGFNAVRLATPPTSEQLREAEECGIWLVAPPPNNHSPTEYGSGLQQIIAWDLGARLIDEDVELTRRVAQRLRSLPAESRRAMICQPREATWEYSRIADLTVLEPPGPNSALPLHDYGHWYLMRSRLLRIGSYFWAGIRTEISPTIAQQVAAMGASPGQRFSLEPEQIRLLTYHAIASGARGLIFRSHTRLDGNDRMSELRAKALQRINLELGLVEPWAATGEHAVELLGNDPQARVSVLRTRRSRLLIVIRQASDQQYVTGPVAEHPIAVDLPNVPDTDEVYLVGEDGLRRVTPQRNTGVHITLDKPRLITTIVVTQDPLVVNFLARQTANLREHQDQLVGDIAAEMYAAVVETHQQLLTSTPATGLSSVTVKSQSLDQARGEFQRFQQLVEGGGHERAYEFLQRGRQQLAQTRYENWKLAAGVFPSPISSPLCTNFFTLPYHYALSRRLGGASWGPNSLAGGDFESLAVLQSSGWENRARHSADLETDVELSLDGPHAGRSALRLKCWPVDPAKAPPVIESPPIRITSAPVPVRRGQLVRVHGWVRVPRAIESTLSGLLIYDSIGGEELAERIRVTEGWREFTLYRAVTRDGPLRMTAALGGIGQAWLDSVTVSAVRMPDAQAQMPHSAAPRR